MSDTNQASGGQTLGLRATADELGITHPALLKAVRTGRVPRNPDGTFDVEICRRAFAANTNPKKSQSARAQQQTVAPEPPVAAVSFDRESPESDESLLDNVPALPADFEARPLPGTMAEASLQLEQARARREQIRVAREEGNLVELAPVNAFVAGMIMRARDEFLRIPAELQDRLAQETDPIKIGELLRGKIDAALAKMSEYRAEQRPAA